MEPRIPKNRTINIPAKLWKALDEDWIYSYGQHITKREILYILEHASSGYAGGRGYF